MSETMQNENISKVENVDVLYKSQQLEFESCDNALIGNFDKNFQYKIYDIIIPELINIEKTIEEKTADKYIAFAILDKTKLNFVVTLEKLKNDLLSATLKLVEKVVVAKIFTTTITTTLQTFTDYDSPDFLYKVRKAFHLVAVGENAGKGSITDYISPPIELLTEILRKKELLEQLKFNREVVERKYVANVLQELRKTESGSVIVKSFVKTLKKNKLEQVQNNKIILYRQLLDKILEDEATKSRLNKEQLEKILAFRTAYIEEFRNQSKNYEKKAENETILGADKPKPKIEAKSSSPSKSSGGGGKSGGGSKGGGGSKDGGKKDDKKKDDKKKEETKLYLSEPLRKKGEAGPNNKKIENGKNEEKTEKVVPEIIENNDEGFLHNQLLTNMQIMKEKIEMQEKDLFIEQSKITKINKITTQKIVEEKTNVNSTSPSSLTEKSKISNIKSFEKDT